MIRRVHRRWDAGLVAALGLVGFALLYAEPVLITASLIPLTYAVYGAVSGVEAVSLRASRTVEAEQIEPGASVEVTLTVENTGETTLPDCRIVDGVPDELAVTEGSPRACLPLRPGDTATLSYTLVARRGAYQFEKPLVEARSLAGSESVATELTVDGESSLLCATPLGDPPRASATTARAGTVPTDAGGSGLEFYATRQYSPGDPMNRIDWRHVAKTGEFVTIQYRREKATRTAIIVDCRPVARVTGKAGYPTAVSLSAYAGEQLQSTLENAGVETTVVAIGLDDDVAEGLVGADGLAWVDTDAATGAAVDALFRGAQGVADRKPAPLSLSAPARSPGGLRDGQSQVAHADGGATAAADATSATEPHSIERIRSRLSPETDVLLCSPLLDDWPVELAHELAVAGHDPTVVSVDVTDGVSPAKRVAAIHRSLRLRTLGRRGVETVDWPLGESVDYVGVALSRAGDSG